MGCKVRMNVTFKKEKLSNFQMRLAIEKKKESAPATSGQADDLKQQQPRSEYHRYLELDELAAI